MKLEALEIPIETLAGSAVAGGVVGVLTSVAAGVAAVGVAIKKSIDKSVEWADALDALQDVTNLTNQEVAGLNYVLRKHGADADTAAKAYVFMSKNLVGLNGELGTTGRALEQFGIKVKDANGLTKTTSQLTEEIAQKYAAIGDVNERVSFLTQVYGKSSMELNDALLDLAENGLGGYIAKAHQLGLDIDADRIQKYKQNTEELKMTWEALGISFGIKAIPAVEALQSIIADVISSPGFQEFADIGLEALQGLSDWIETNAPGWSEDIASGMENLKTFGEDVRVSTEKAEAEILRYMRNVRDLAKLEEQGLTPANVNLASSFEQIAIITGADLVAIWKDLKGIGTDLWDLFKKITGASDDLSAKGLILQSVTDGIKLKFLQWHQAIRALREGLEFLKGILDDMNQPNFLSLAGQALARGAGNRASGGPVIAGQSYNVAEFFRPEVFTPSTSGRVDPMSNQPKEIIAKIDEERLVRLFVSAMQQGALT